MPPVEWVNHQEPHSASVLALLEHQLSEPLARRQNMVAPVASLRARLRAAKARGDTTSERVACVELARQLAALGTELDTATKLARRALLLADEPQLRDELSSWLAGLGEPALAAATLRPLLTGEAGQKAAQTLLRIAVLLARADDASGAVDALKEAAREDPSDPLALELLGAIGAWASDAVTSEEAADFYLEAARRRAARKEKSLSFDDVLRAFEAATYSREAAHSLAAELSGRGRDQAADEVWRQHAQSLGSQAAHLERMQRAVLRGDTACAFGAALDARLDTTLDLGSALRLARQLAPVPPEVLGLEELLEWVGLKELLSARLELCADALSGEERGIVQQKLSQLSAGTARATPQALSSWRALIDAGAAGDELARANALELLGTELPVSLRAVALSASAEAHAAAGDLDRAWQLAGRAFLTDPSLARTAAVRAQLVLVQPSLEGAAEVLERAVAVTVPRAALCEALARLHELEEPILSLAWAERWLVLRPGDSLAAASVLSRAAELGDEERLSQALSWLLSQPQPLEVQNKTIAQALSWLTQINPSWGISVAQRAMNVLGPRDAEWRNAVVAIADLTGEQDLAVSILERWLATDSAPSERAEWLLAMAERNKVAGRADAAARALWRAALADAPVATVLSELETALPPQSFDGELALLEARAEALSRLQGSGPEMTIQTLRELGAARWDMAGDVDGALQAWHLAAMLDLDRGAIRLSQDFAAFAGAERAMQSLVSLSAQYQESPKEASRLLAAASAVAVHDNRSSEAMSLARQALELDPSRADALALAERCAGPEDSPMLDGVYDHLAEASLGCYGERAIRYRAARHFERRGQPALALRHAVGAFEAVPAEGVTFRLMTRVAHRAGSTDQVVKALARVGSRCQNRTEGSEWLKRAAGLSDATPTGQWQRVEVLLQALQMHPDLEAMLALGASCSALLEAQPDQLDGLKTRFADSVSEMMARLSGPYGAQIALRAARTALECFDLRALALKAVERAVEASIDSEAFLELSPEVHKLARESESATALVARLVGFAENEFSGIGVALLEFGSELARAVSDPASSLKLLLAAGKLDPQRKDLRARAYTAVLELGDPRLLTHILADLPADRRITELGTTARSLEEAGKHEVALRFWSQVLELSPGDEPALAALERDAERRRDYRALADLLARRAAAASNLDEVRRLVFRRATVLEQRLQEPEVAREELTKLLSTAGDNLSVLRVLADLNQRMGRHLEAAEHWQRASALTKNAEEAIDLTWRACESALRGGELGRAGGLLKELDQRAPSAPVLKLRVQLSLELAQKLTARGQYKPALSWFETVLSGELHEVRERGEVALEAAECARDSGDPLLAKKYAEMAAADEATRPRALKLLEQLRPAPPQRSLTPTVSIEPSAPPVSPRVVRADLDLGTIPPRSTEEGQLLEQLKGGSVPAGRSLIQQLEERPQRSNDLVTVCRHLTGLLPGDSWCLEKLQSAALADRNPGYARAVEHVLQIARGAAQSIEPPPLSEQSEQPESVRAMLLRDSVDSAAEALALLWEGAEHVFRRDPNVYGVTGLERVVLGAPSPLARMVSTAARALGLTRVPVFHRRDSSAVTINVALLSPPALIVSGEMRQETPEFSFHIGAMLTATLPCFVLLFGLPEGELQSILDALMLAFGPPRPAQTSKQPAVSLAEVLWESIPVRSQRRSREVCDRVEGFSYGSLLASSRHALHRAGLFVCGDLRIAVREASHDAGLDAEAMREPSGLARLCAASPAVTDLVLLATSPIYAETRWQPARAGQRKQSGGWSAG